jgi:hypothetical protein
MGTLYSLEIEALYRPESNNLLPRKNEMRLTQPCCARRYRRRSRASGATVFDVQQAGGYPPLPLRRGWAISSTSFLGQVWSQRTLRFAPALAQAPHFLSE